MKILFFSDIHGITNNLKVLEELDNKEHFDKIVCLGDLYYSGPTFDNSLKLNSKDVLDFLMKYIDRLIVLKGNCDSDVDIKASDFPICSNLALINTDNLDIYLTHGNEYSMSKNRKFNRKGILVYGHEHIPYIRQNNDMIYICVGSISLPRGESKASYMIYNNKTFTLYSIDNKVIDEVVL
ncbi:MAG: phosphodiesterase [Bacilli bacterium]|nr:phosphodiesterase [Bacilli bacterium]